MGMFDNKKAWVWSAVGHLLILVISIVGFVVRPHATTPPDSVAIDIISADDLAHITKGIESGDKTKKTPLAEKVDEPKKVDDAVGKIARKEIVTETAPAPAPETPKPVEKKPEPPKPVAEKKDEPQKAEKKPEPKIDPIAEALKKDDSKKPTPKQEAKAAPPPKPAPKREYQFDTAKMAALIDKRDPSREAIAGAQLSNERALGKSTGMAVNNSATWGAMFKQQVERCWNKPYGGEIRQPMVSITVRLSRDGALQAAPKLEQPASDPTVRAYQETAVRAVLQCQPYRLPPTMYEGDFGWNFFTADFVDESRG